MYAERERHKTPHDVSAFQSLDHNIVSSNDSFTIVDFDWSKEETKKIKNHKPKAIETMT